MSGDIAFVVGMLLAGVALITLAIGLARAADRKPKPSHADELARKRARINELAGQLKREIELIERMGGESDA